MRKAHRVVRQRIKLNLQGVSLSIQKLILSWVIKLKSLETLLFPEAQAPPIPLRGSIVPSPPRPSKIPVLQRLLKKSIDVQTSQVVKPKTKVPSKLDMTKYLVKIGLSSCTNEPIESWWEYRNMQYTRREARKIKQEERSRNPTQKSGQSYCHNSTFFLREPETYNQAISSSEKESWLQAMQEELKPLSDTNTWTLVESPKTNI